MGPTSNKNAKVQTFYLFKLDTWNFQDGQANKKERFNLTKFGAPKWEVPQLGPSKLKLFQPFKLNT